MHRSAQAGAAEAALPRNLIHGTILRCGRNTLKAGLATFDPLGSPISLDVHVSCQHESAVLLMTTCKIAIASHCNSPEMWGLIHAEG